MSRLNSFSSEINHLLVREDMKWGTYGKSQRNPLRWVVLKDMEDSHIRNILIDVRQEKYNISSNYLYHFQKELQFRIIGLLEPIKDRDEELPEVFEDEDLPDIDGIFD